MLRFVILQHELPASDPRAGIHFDWMFEVGEELLTFAVDEISADARSRFTMPAQALPNHRLAYLEYEGEVSNGRGSVSQWDSGAYEGGWTLHDQRWAAQIHGQRLVGHVEIARTENAWKLTFQPQNVR